MITRNMRKNLAGMQDLLQGVGNVVQSRNDQELAIAGIDLPYAVATELEMQNLDVLIFTRARVYKGTTSYTDYIYDENATTGVLSNTGSGNWVEIAWVSSYAGMSSVVWDFATDGGAIGDIMLGSLPADASIVSAFYEVLITLTSAGAATVALGIAVDDVAGLLAATAFDNAAMLPGYHNATPDGTAINFTTKSTDQRDIIMSVAGSALTAGKIRIWFSYIRS